MFRTLSLLKTTRGFEGKEVARCVWALAQWTPRLPACIKTFDTSKRYGMEGAFSVVVRGILHFSEKAGNNSP